MDQGVDAVRWAPRVKRHAIRRLYELDARGIVDQELIDDVGTALYARIGSILTVAEAQRGRVRCPVCERAGHDTFIARGYEFDLPFVCPRCGWSTTWRDYLRTYKRKQLNIGGAGPAFEVFVKAWREARTPQHKMLAIDQVIHAWHFSLRDQPDLPCRAAAVNLIDGKLGEVVAFLDQLTFGENSTPGLAAQQAAWRKTADEVPWGPKLASSDQG